MGCKYTELHFLIAIHNMGTVQKHPPHLQVRQAVAKLYKTISWPGYLLPPGSHSPLEHKMS